MNGLRVEKRPFFLPRGDTTEKLSAAMNLTDLVCRVDWQTRAYILTMSLVYNVKRVGLLKSLPLKCEQWRQLVQLLARGARRFC